MNNGILVDLETLRDIQFSNLKRFGLNNIFKNYHNRIKNSVQPYTDDFIGHLYRTRNYEDLVNSLVTGINPLIMEYVLEATISTGQPTLYLIIGNYDLSEETKKILKKEYKLFFKVIDVILLDKIPSIDYIQTHIAIIYMYKGLEWINDLIVDMEIYKKDLVTTVLVVPSIVYWETENPQELLEQYRVHTAPYIKLRYIDTRYFCHIME